MKKSTGYQGLEISIRYSQETGYFYASLLREGELITEQYSPSGAEICRIADSLLGEEINQENPTYQEVGFSFCEPQKGGE